MNKQEIRRLAICPHTKEEVEQVLEENGNWLCLHNEVEE